MAPITLRTPTTLPSATKKNSTLSLQPPTPTFLEGTWHVTHSTLPMWKSKQNVKINYIPLASNPSLPAGRMESVVSSQPLNKPKISTMKGIETPIEEGQPGHQWAFNWKGEGLLLKAAGISRWEILGYGEEESGKGAPVDAAAQEVSAEGELEGQKKTMWIVTYFSKTLFTPAGMDVYCRKKEGVSEATLQSIKDAMAEMDDPSIKKLAGEMFAVKRTY